MRASERGQSTLLLLDVIDILDKLKIAYAVVGALAVAFYGVVRASLDADAVISVADQANTLKHLKDNLTELGFKTIVKKGGSDDPLAGVMLIEDEFENQVDLILGIQGLDKAAFQRTRQGTLSDGVMDIIGPEDLIAMKIFAGSHKDINDVKGILKVSGQKLDKKLLKALTAQYGTRELNILEGLLSQI